MDVLGQGCQNKMSADALQHAPKVTKKKQHDEHHGKSFPESFSRVGHKSK
jgi:hypothetical protein